MSAIIETDWADIYTDYFDKIFRYVKRRVGYVDVCEDLVSETFVKAIEATQNGTGAQSHFNGWLYRIAHNLVVDHYRIRDRIEEEPLEYAEHIHDEQIDPLDGVAADERRKRLYGALRQLSDDQQRVLVLRFEYGMEFEEIGCEMGKTAGAVKALQHRAFSRANGILRGTVRVGQERKPNCVDDMAAALREHGPMTVKQVCEQTGRGYATAGVTMLRNPDVFVKVGKTETRGVETLIWGLVEAHDGNRGQ